MKFTVTLSLLALFALTSCEVDEPPRRTTRGPATRPAQTTTAAQQAAQQYPPQPQPFPEDIAPAQTTPPPEVAAPPTTTTATTTTTTGTTTSAAPKSDPPYGIPVPGKPGFVTSPYSPDKITDVRGYAPGTEVKDPYTGKIFLVP
jgi:hypothetical protein